MSLPPSTGTYTDFTKYYYSNNCTDVLNKLNHNIKCNRNFEIEECCKYMINKIYDVEYDLNKCYYVNDTFIEFKCNEETGKDFMTTLIIAFCMSLCMCLCVVIYEMNKLGYFNCKKERTFSNHLLVNQNPTYGT